MLFIEISSLSIQASLEISLREQKLLRYSILERFAICTAVIMYYTKHFLCFFLVVTRPPPVVTRQTRKPWQRPNPDRWPTTTNWNNMVTFPPTPMMPTIAPKYPSGPWQNNRNRFPIRTTPSTTMSTTTTTTTTTLPPSKI